MIRRNRRANILALSDPWYSRSPVIIQPSMSMIRDLSYNRAVVSAYGNAALSANQSKFFGSSIYFDGNGDYLQLPYLSDYNLVGYDFTIEVWLYLTATTSGNQHIVGKDEYSGSTYPQYALGISSAGKFFGGVGSGNSASSWQALTADSALSLNTWHHVVFERVGTTLYLLTDGLRAATPVTQTATQVANTRNLLVGYSYNSATSAYFNGYIEMVRITKGLARYVSPYGVPTQECLVE